MSETIEEIAKRAAAEHFSNPDVLRELCTPGFAARFCWGAEFHGIEECVKVLKASTRHPRVVIDDCFSTNDRVVVRFRAFFSVKKNKEIERNEISILCFEDGRISEWWVAFDRQFEKDQRSQAT